jgi:hypothetical protein
MQEHKCFVYNFSVTDTDIIIQAVSKYVNFGCTLIDANRIINNIQQAYANQTDAKKLISKVSNVEHIDDLHDENK